jgi:hypothetical protein
MWNGSNRHIYRSIWLKVCTFSSNSLPLSTLLSGWRGLTIIARALTEVQSEQMTTTGVCQIHADTFREREDGEPQVFEMQRTRAPFLDLTGSFGVAFS